MAANIPRQATSHDIFSGDPLRIPDMPILRFVPDPEASGLEKPFILSYLGMRQLAGWVGFALPFAVTLGNWPHALEGSISAYYFTRTGAWFVGSLWVIGFFMGSCRGYDKWDERAGRFAGVFALGVALIPMNYCEVKSGWIMYRGWLHWTFLMATLIREVPHASFPPGRSGVCPGVCHRL